MHGLDKPSVALISNEVTVDVKVLRSFVEDRVSRDVLCSVIVIVQGNGEI